MTGTNRLSQACQSHACWSGTWHSPLSGSASLVAGTSRAWWSTNACSRSRHNPQWRKHAAAHQMQLPSTPVNTTRLVKYQQHKGSVLHRITNGCITTSHPSHGGKCASPLQVPGRQTLCNGLIWRYTTMGCHMFSLKSAPSRGGS